MASLSVKGIIKKFGRTMALGGVDLEVEDGRFCVLLGPSGCGKSTLLNIIAGLIPQDAGMVLIDGKKVDRLYPRERDVAMVFQSYALYPHMTVAQNLAFGLKMRKTPPVVIEARVMEAARLLGIEELLGRKPKELSGGQRQRVAMGRALVRRPKLFLLDEPLSNLDARLRAKVRIELRQLHQKVKGTIVYVTHDQVEAMTLGDKVVVMEGGRIVQTGRAEEIYDRPVDTFVARFIGSPEMNILEGLAANKDGQLVFEGQGFCLDLGPLGLDIDIGPAEIGIRPEDFGFGFGPGLEMKVLVDMQSNIGSEKYIQARLGQKTLTVRASKEKNFTPGREAALFVPPDRIHFFVQGKRVEF